MLSGPTTKISVKCPICKLELSASSVEMQMTREQLDVYLMHMSMKHIDENDQVVNCPFWKYFEIWNKDCTSNFFYCKKEGCKKGSCSICHKEFKVPSSDFQMSNTEFEEIKSNKGMMSHTRCYEYKHMKDDWDEAIETGIKRWCPNCGIGGLKNSDCTHILCNNCRTEWCYVWGKALKDLDIDPTMSGISGHNNDWNTNPKRCPMYLFQIHEIDKRYSQNDYQCKMFLHKLITYKNIRKFFKKYSLRDFKKLCQTFPAVRSHGYDLQEAMTMDITIIRRS